MAQLRSLTNNAQFPSQTDSHISDDDFRNEKTTVMTYTGRIKS